MGMTRRQGGDSQENQSLIANEETDEVVVAGPSGENASVSFEQL